MLKSLPVDDELELTPVSKEDAAKLFALVEKNRAYLREWLPWLDFNTKVDHTRQFILRSINQATDKTGWVTLMRFHSEVVGVMGFNYIDQLHRTCEIGYWIDQEHQRLGIVSRCTKRLIDYAFSELELNKVNIGVATQNSRSRAIPERLGFTIEGESRQAEWLYDHFVNHTLYSLLKSEWTTAQHD